MRRGNPGCQWSRILLDRRTLYRFASLVDEQIIKGSIDQTCFKTLEGNSSTKWHDNNIKGILSSQGF
jgi:hypothetical protein